MRVKCYFLYHDLPFPTADMQDCRQSAAALGPALTTCKLTVWDSLLLLMKYKIHMTSA